MGIFKSEREGYFGRKPIPGIEYSYKDGTYRMILHLDVHGELLWSEAEDQDQAFLARQRMSEFAADQLRRKAAELDRVYFE